MIGEQKMPDIILVSGGFDPIHSGHIKLINEANKYGDVVVLLNSDAWLPEKKGKPFMPMSERKMIVKHLEMVDDVIEWDDSDGSACNAIQHVLVLQYIDQLASSIVLSFWTMNCLYLMDR